MLTADGFAWVYVCVSLNLVTCVLIAFFSILDFFADKHINIIQIPEKM